MSFSFRRALYRRVIKFYVQENSFRFHSVKLHAVVFCIDSVFL